MMSVFLIETKRIWDIHRHSILHLLSWLKYPFKWEMGAAFHPQIVHFSRDVWPSVTWRTDKQEWLTSRSFEWTWTVGPLVDFQLAPPSHKIPLPNLPYQFLKYISVEDFWQLVFFFFWGGGQTCELDCWSLWNFLLNSVNMLMATMSNSLTPALLPI